MNKTLGTLGRVLANAFLILSSITFLFPIIWLLYSSLKSQAEFDANSIALPKIPTLANFIHVFSISEMPRYMFNSIRITLVAVVLIMLLSFIIGYFFTRFSFKGRSLLYGFYLVGLLIPVHSLMVPMYVMFSKLGLNNHFYTLILPYLAFQLPIGVYLMESFIRSVPIEMEEAAALDGAGFTYTLFRIIMPMTVPAMTTLGIIAFFYCWNEFSFALILTTDAALRTVPLGLTLFKGTYTTNYPVMMAGMMVAVAPVLILYGIFSKNIMKGMVAGAVKG